ncbi:MAG: electron transport complex subunit RsxC [Lentisphaeria bacterium]|nr:electron transport complex subunit RsxC [Lentisphaeria bacterium]
MMNKSSRNVMTFNGGIHPAGDGKKLSSGKPVQTPPLLEKYFVLLAENAGKPPKCIVKKGEHIQKYQLIAQQDGAVSANLHAPTSGTVADIKEVPGPMGVPSMAVEISADGEDRGEPPMEILHNWEELPPEILLKRVSDAGLVGMGGASFPSHVKLTPPPDKKVDTLILNGAECEPYLTADHRLMLENAEKVVRGAAIFARILQVKNAVIGVEINKDDAIAALEHYADKYGVKIACLQVRYPQGSEKQLIDAITGRAVPIGKLPMDAGCVVQNVATAAALSDAVTAGIPLVERIVTVTGDVVCSPGNWKLKIGTPVLEAVRFAGGVTEEPGKLILGGPMMGFAQRSFAVPVSKNTSGILLLPEKLSVNYEASGCIRCGRCVQGCPMHLMPCHLSTAIEAGRFDLAAQNHVMDCMECGSCAYVCPDHRPLVQNIRRAKAEIRLLSSREKKNNS